jgi:ribosomal protein L13E
VAYLLPAPIIQLWSRAMTKRTIRLHVETHTPEARTVRVPVETHTYSLGVGARNPLIRPAPQHHEIPYTSLDSPEIPAPEPHVIRKHRNRRGFTVAQCARRAGVAQRSWRRWEDGSRPMPADLWRSFLDW